MRGKSKILLPDISLQDDIPRIVHQTYISKQLPDVLRNNVEALKRDNPDWEHRFYDDDDIVHYIDEHYGSEMTGLYRKISPQYGPARADFFRYLALYRHGGIYLDIKSRFLRPIREVVRGDEGYIISQWRNGAGEVHEGWGLHADLQHIKGGEFQQWHVIAAPGHPFLRAVIERVIHGIDHYSARRTGTGWIGVLRLTGPIAYTSAIAPLIGRYPCKIIENELAIDLDYSTMPQSNHQQLVKRHYTKNTDAVVLNTGAKRIADDLFIKARALKNRLR